jgi:hypothetical protein
MVGFRDWLQNEEQTAGMVDGTRTDNFVSDDDFQNKIPQSRYRARNRNKVKSEFDPDKKFGQKPKYQRV